jgi:integrase
VKRRLAKRAGVTVLQDHSDATFGSLFDVYVQKRIMGHSAKPEKTKPRLEQMVARYIPHWRNMRADAITRGDVGNIHHSVGREYGKPTANRLIQVVRAVFNFVDREEIWTGRNPASKIARFKESSRARYILPEELPRFFAALREEPNRDLSHFIQLSLWTKARKSDVMSMRWKDLSAQGWMVPSPKAGVPYLIPLTAEATAVLESRRREATDEWVFPSRGRSGHAVDFKKSWKRFLESARIRDLRQHDLRRTLSSYEAAAGTSLNVVGKGLGHASLSATQVYARLDTVAVRKSMDAASAVILEAAGRKLLPAETK